MTSVPLPRTDVTVRVHTVTLTLTPLVGTSAAQLRLRMAARNPAPYGLDDEVWRLSDGVGSVCGLGMSPVRGRVTSGP